MRLYGIFGREKGFIKLVVSVLSLSVVFCFLTAYLMGMSARNEKFTVDRTYYFVAKEGTEETVSAVAGALYSGGAAAYNMSYGGKVYVVLAAYNEKDTAQSVAKGVQERGTDCEVLPLKIGTFYFTTAKSVGIKQETEWGVGVLLSMAEMFYSLSNGVAEGDYTQREAKILLSESKKLLSSGEEGCKNSPVSGIFNRTQRKLEEILSGVVYSKDVRYLQIELIEEVYQMQKYYSL